jgi:hypothetical protein
MTETIGLIYSPAAVGLANHMALFYEKGGGSTPQVFLSVSKVRFMGSKAIKFGIRAAIALAMLFSVAQVSSQTPNNNVSSDTGIESSQAVCAARLAQFVRELDDMLTENSGPLTRFNDLIERYFPLKGCDVEEVTKICRGSKYLHGVSTEYVGSNVIWFGNSKYTVGFALRKPSGDTELPYAMPVK